MKSVIFSFILFSLLSCSPSKKMHWFKRNSAITGSGFYHQASGMQWLQRDSFARQEILSGNIPSFLRKFTPVHISMVDSATGRIIKAAFYVAPDYLSIGTDDDWARIHITPKAAQQIADTFHCFLPTKKWLMIFTKQQK